MVTGAGRGIGAETALLLAEQGARVAVVDLTEEAATPIADQVKAAKDQVSFGE